MDTRSVVESSLEIKVIRANGSVEDRGMVSYWHRNPFRRLLYRIRQWL